MDVSALPPRAGPGSRRAQEPAGHHAAASRQPSAVVWHELECGSYTADLPLWRDLAGARPNAPTSRVLEIGAGSGRVALALARDGHAVTAVDLDAELLGALRERAASAGVAAIETVHGDARELALQRRDHGLCLVPMQTIQLLGGASGRLAFLRRARAHLTRGALLACAIVTELEPFDTAAGDIGPSPEIARIEDVTYISCATRLHIGRRKLRIERQRRAVADADASSPAPPRWEHHVIELDRVSVAQLQHDARQAGLLPVGTREISATIEHSGSLAVLLRA